MVAFEYMRQLRGGSGSAAYKKYERRLRERAVVGLPLIIENPTGRELANFRSWFHRNYEVRTWTMHGNLYIELES